MCLLQMWAFLSYQDSSQLRGNFPQLNKFQFLVFLTQSNPLVICRNENRHAMDMYCGLTSRESITTTNINNAVHNEVVNIIHLNEFTSVANAAHV